VASPQIPEPGHDRRQRVAGRAVLYYRMAAVQRAGGTFAMPTTPEAAPRARDSPRGPLRGRESVRFAPALIALDTQFVIRTLKGERVVNAEDYFIGLNRTSTRLNILRPGI